MKKTQHVLEYSQPSIQGHVIKRVKIIGTLSAHGWKYPAGVLQEAIPLYESCPVFISHPDPRERRRGTRLLRDHLGNLGNVSGNGDGLFGDLTVKPSHPLARQILEEAPRASFGLSHNAVVELSGDETEATRIVEVNSVDLVDDPATTKNLFEENAVSENKDERTLEETMSAFLAKLKKDAPGCTVTFEAGERKTKTTKRLTALEDRGDDDVDAPTIGNTHEDFLGAVRGFSLK